MLGCPCYRLDVETGRGAEGAEKVKSPFDPLPQPQSGRDRGVGEHDPCGACGARPSREEARRLPLVSLHPTNTHPRPCRDHLTCQEQECTGVGRFRNRRRSENEVVISVIRGCVIRLPSSQVILRFTLVGPRSPRRLSAEGPCRAQSSVRATSHVSCGRRSSGPCLGG